MNQECEVIINSRVYSLSIVGDATSLQTSHISCGPSTIAGLESVDWTGGLQNIQETITITFTSSIIDHYHTL